MLTPPSDRETGLLAYLITDTSVPPVKLAVLEKSEWNIYNNPQLCQRKEGKFCLLS
jgi:hypothetical protein